MILNDHDKPTERAARPSPTKTPDSAGTTAMTPTSKGSSKRSKTTSAPAAIVNIEDDSDLELLQDAAGFVPVESHGKKAVAKAKAIAKQSLKQKQQVTNDQKKQQAAKRPASSTSAPTKPTSAAATISESFGRIRKHIGTHKAYIQQRDDAGRWTCVVNVQANSCNYHHKCVINDLMEFSMGAGLSIEDVRAQKDKLCEQWCGN